MSPRQGVHGLRSELLGHVRLLGELQLPIVHEVVRAGLPLPLRTGHAPGRVHPREKLPLRRHEADFSGKLENGDK